MAARTYTANTSCRQITIGYPTIQQESQSNHNRLGGFIIEKCVPIRLRYIVV